MTEELKIEDFHKWALKVFEIARKFKKIMIKNNLKRAKTECPECKAILWGSIQGKRNHFHMKCSNPTCNILFME